MPKAKHFRNFWLTAQADGGSPVTLGPKSKDGGLHATLLLRELGQISSDKIEIDSHVDVASGALLTVMHIPAGARIKQNEDGSSTIYIEKER